MNELTEWYSILGNVGFPIGITFYLLIRFEKKIDKLEVSISELGQAIRNNNAK